jgi:hypothetical protein
MRTLEPTPDHTGPYDDAAVWDTIPADFVVHNAGAASISTNNCYAITNDLDNGIGHRAGFIYSG